MADTLQRRPTWRGIRPACAGIWYDRSIESGQDWKGGIVFHIERATIAILLVGPGFLASPFVRDVELPLLRRLRMERALQIIPVLRRPCLSATSTFLFPDPALGPERFSLQSLQTPNPADRPLSALAPSLQDEVLVTLAERVRAPCLPATAGSGTAASRADARARSLAAGVRPVRTDRSQDLLIRRVMHDWIDDYLSQSLSLVGGLRMPLGLDSAPGAVQRPWDAVKQIADPEPQALPSNASIGDVFHDACDALLVLGEPGVGKTSGHVALLPDGLDEVPAAAREDCLRAVNAFRQAHGDVAMAGCCRSGDYAELSAKLKYGAAVRISPLTPERILEMAKSDDGR